MPGTLVLVPTKMLARVMPAVFDVGVGRDHARRMNIFSTSSRG